ncbi:hypothetical protein K7432_010410 [Basidiobolus ranarum]|uniref:Uncharacterized protein n=1 Tax=Basidiobolus ranarum TaxID=34480 RepID=A0ABR2WNW6_9FUNG
MGGKPSKSKRDSFHSANSTHSSASTTRRPRQNRLVKKYKTHSGVSYQRQLNNEGFAELNQTHFETSNEPNYFQAPSTYKTKPSALNIFRTRAASNSSLANTSDPGQNLNNLTLN